mmetsp:Transcript_3253/g.6346  ORF Transcript_3253/g.6346 Transcript_3253/m.6346 type:complete len:224 (+) Transcript_3253:70-741(+)|eukprot:CAMPEP_0119062488 /NCGR_PEP_ID=MMETSP1178-20130426/6059_1 /TAXON_ID=33656 /ORGANISM="unid sp, Strain CCMP2000" /LENGTH=223 /DNA_ID=CAMNT_0007043771 /DNA_START=70 /DNA_END=741 /DNA_ORIENTATION=-
MSGKKVAILCTSSDKMGDHATGAWSEEITGSYYTFADAGCAVTLYSVKGGKIPIDAGSLSDQFKTENDKRWESSGDVAKLEASESLASIKADEIDCLFLAGGHGTCVDFDGGEVGAVVTEVFARGKVVGAVCHGPTGLVMAKDGDKPLVAGKKVAAFSDVEEEQVGLTEKVPFLLEAKLKELGCEYVPGSPWSETAVRDGKLVTGQNPQSSVKAAKLCLEAMA